MENLVGFVRNHLQNNFNLAWRFSEHPTETAKSTIEMLYDQSYGSVELLVAWLNYQRDPDNLVPALLEMWNGYREKFNELLEK